MDGLGCSRAWHCLAAVAACLLSIAGPTHAAPPQPQLRSAAEYRDHLQALSSLVSLCQQHTDAAHCRASAVGADDHVATPGRAELRLVSYAWLRDTLDHAGDTRHPLKAAEVAPLLQAAAERVKLEQSQAPGANRTAAPVPAAQSGTHLLLSGILARQEFRHTDRSLLQRVEDSVALWINRHLMGLAEYSSHRRWLGRVLVWGLVSLACLGLAVWFIRQTRRARGLSLGDAARIETVPALRSWERWRQDAEEAAQQQRWRDAVRAFYWATIARMESRGQWPADRARTPREYLRLLIADHPKHHDLRMLTQRFEACWYGAAIATQPDCDAARQLCDRLVTR